MNTLLAQRPSMRGAHVQRDVSRVFDAISDENGAGDRFAASAARQDGMKTQGTLQALARTEATN